MQRCDQCRHLTRSQIWHFARTCSQIGRAWLIYVLGVGQLPELWQGVSPIGVIVPS